MSKNLPKIFGILNITEDSFSDGGLFLREEDAISHTGLLIKSGADVIDVGPSASNPDARKVSPRDEIRRAAPVVERFRGEIPISIDSFNPETQVWAMENGVDYLNDIHGFPDAGIYSRIAEADCKLIVVHSIRQGWKADREYTDPDSILNGIKDFFEKRVSALTSSGIARRRIIADPGMGYFLGSNPEPSIRVLRDIRKLKRDLGLPVMISVSRKSFLRAITGREVRDILPATLAAEIHGAEEGVDYIRTHDVRALCDALKVLSALSD